MSPLDQENSLNKPENRPIPKAWNYGPRDVSLLRNECLHQIFEQSADAYPNHTAIIFGTTSVSYAEVEARANALAHYLRSLGVTKGTGVGLCLEKSVELYVSMLAIMKAGAYYVPLDPSYPPERTSYILEDSQVRVLILTTETHRDGVTSENIINLDTEDLQIQSLSTKRLTQEEVGVTTNDLAYVLYTSGSTGKPKGVMLEHKGICNLVRASQEIYGITSEDRVYQGMSVSFDFSLEEIWMAFVNGATLIPATSEMAHSAHGLSKLMTDAGVTALSCVPTLFTLLNEDIPTLRFINVGGEDCPPSLVTKWWKPGRRIFNTYGPTETTTNATYAECFPDKKITIGRPLPNYSAYILDEKMQPVPVGEPGELLIGGVGLARGYVNRDDLTQEKFIPNPFATEADDSPRLYKTGDLVQFDENGEIVYLGRIDTQVKIRGFRIELSEIESLVSTTENVKTSVASVYEKVPGLKSIVVYILPTRKDALIDIAAIRQLLKARLPAYMLPRYIEIIHELPQLPNGKTDRKKLPPPQSHSQDTMEDIIPPTTDMEKTIALVWEDVFENNAISITDHFFYDLGGHSLFAAKVTSELRAQHSIHQVSISDIYAHPTIETLAAALHKRARETPEKKASAQVSHRPVSKLVYTFSTLAQGFGTYLIYLLIALPFIIFYSLSEFDAQLAVTTLSERSLIIYVSLVLLAYFPAMLVLSLLAKWLIIGRYRAGEYPLWGWYYFRFWIVRRIQTLVPVHYLAGTPLIGIYFRLMGAKIGKDSFIGTYLFQAYDLIEIGDHASIGVGSQLLGFTVENGLLKIAPIKIGDNCFIGTLCVVSPGATMSSDTRLSDLSMLSSDAIIPNNESWVGSPAAKEKNTDPDLDAMVRAAHTMAPYRRVLFGLLHLFVMFLFPLIVFLPYLPVSLLSYFFYQHIGFWSLLVAIPFAPLYILVLSLEIVLLKKLILPRIEANTYQLDSLFYLRKWIVDELMNISLLSMNTLFATLYTPTFLRMLGAKIGKRVEVSTVAHIAPDLLSLGDESFVADMACLGTPKVYRNMVTIAETVVGRRTFVGNAALVPINTKLGNNCLVGVLSTSPSIPCDDNTSWLGLPPIFLPKRDINTSFSEQETYAPSTDLYIKRYSIEFFRVTLPTALNTMILMLSIFSFHSLYSWLAPWMMVLFLPILIFTMQLFGVMLVILLKWLIIGKYVPRIKPQWSTFVWKSELITGLYEDVVAAPFLRNMLGTPFAAWFLRMLGVSIGRRVYLDTTYVTEFDLVKVSSDVALNFNCSLQTHLFEDRVMKMSYIDIEDHCSVGNNAIVLYDTKMHSGANLRNLSLVMKGESLPEHTSWEGVPAQPCR